MTPSIVFGLLLIFLLFVNAAKIRPISMSCSEDGLKTASSPWEEIQSEIGLWTGKTSPFPKDFSNFMHIKMLSQTFVIVNRRCRGTDSHFHMCLLQHSTQTLQGNKTLQWYEGKQLVAALDEIVNDVHVIWKDRTATCLPAQPHTLLQQQVQPVVCVCVCAYVSNHNPIKTHPNLNQHRSD